MNVCSKQLLTTTWEVGSAAQRCLEYSWALSCGGGLSPQRALSCNTRWLRARLINSGCGYQARHALSITHSRWRFSMLVGDSSRFLILALFSSCGPLIEHKHTVAGSRSHTSCTAHTTVDTSGRWAGGRAWAGDGRWAGGRWAGGRAGGRKRQHGVTVNSGGGKTISSIAAARSSM